MSKWSQLKYKENKMSDIIKELAEEWVFCILTEKEELQK